MSPSTKRRWRLLTHGLITLVLGAVTLIWLEQWISMPAFNPADLPITTDLGVKLRKHVDYLASQDLKGRKPGTPGNRAAAEYIAAEFRRAGLNPLPSLEGLTQLITPEIGDNVIGARCSKSSKGDMRWILLGAHYDHLGESGSQLYLGADDNASAIAILIETAKAVNALSHYSVLYTAFNTEEPPFIRTPDMGSQYFVDHLPKEIGTTDNLQAAIIMDLMGGVHWEPTKNVIFAAGAEHSPGLYRHIKRSSESAGHHSPLAVLPVGLHSIEEIPLFGKTPVSDYDAFRNQSVPVLFLSAGRTPRYHRPSDLPDTLHYERMALTVSWLHELLHKIDEDDKPYTFETERIEFADEVETFRPFITQAAREETMIPGTSSLSIFRLKQDAKWIAQLHPRDASEQDIKRLEKAALRMQCLLADFPGCFLL